MGRPPLNKEARLHRLFNQRRIALSLVERSQTLLAPGVPFNSELAAFFKSQGKFGSSDRRLYRELIFAYLRYKPWIDELRDDKDAQIDMIIRIAAPIKEVLVLYPTLKDELPPKDQFENRHRLIGKTDEDLIDLIPDWIASHYSVKPTTEDITRIFKRCPLWLRIQKGDPFEIIEQLEKVSKSETEVEHYHRAPNVIKAPTNLPLLEVPAYVNGEIEVQDISSQLLLLMLDPTPTGNWLDACAGAGGKTLQLSQILGSDGKVIAYDARQSALRELEKRAKRAGVRNIEIRYTRPTYETFDGVLVDAPCSGSGTWRRHPFLMRQTREKDVMAHSERQQSLLDHYSKLVGPNGRLVYCTCSLSSYENEYVAEKFLGSHEDFVHEPLGNRFDLKDEGKGITIRPNDFDGDGLYITSFKRDDESRPTDGFSATA